MTNCAAVGHPVGHSLSPVIHREAYRLLGLDDWRYGLHDLAPHEFVAFVESRDASWRGLSVTMPHKEATARLGEPDADVRLTGVANTLLWHGAGRRSVHNTDIEGFVAALASRPRPATATVLGAGATARSAVVALARLGCRAIQVTARSRDRAASLVDWAVAHVPLSGDGVDDGGPRAAGYSVGDWTALRWFATDVVVSTLPHDAAAPLAGALATAGGSAPATLFDVAYDPWPTPLAAAALASGVTVLDGIDLLVHQAVAQVRLMTGLAVDAAPLLSAARAELGRRAGA